MIVPSTHMALLTISRTLSLVWVYTTTIAADGVMCGYSLGPDREWFDVFPINAPC